MAKGKKTSLAVRAAAFMFALALAALAARLWIGSAPRETSATRAASEVSGADDARAGEDAGADAAPDPVSTAPPLHGEHSARDQEALRDILRDSQGETP